MKKTLVALAALAAVSAYAQSSVTLYGRLDVGSQQNKTTAVTTNGAGVVTANTTTKTSELAGADSVRTGGRLGVRVSEDLGGGLRANAVYEFRLDADDVAAAGYSNARTNFGRTRTGLVQLASPAFGSVSVGTYLNTIDDARGFTAGTAGTAGGDFLANNNTGLTDGRSTNSIGYVSPDFGGFKFKIGGTRQKLEVANNVTGATSTSSSRGVLAALTYDNGPLSMIFVTAAGKSVHFAAATAAQTAVAFPALAPLGATIDAKAREANFSVSYNFGVAIPYLQLQSGKATNNLAAVGAPRDAKVRAYELGSKFPLGAFTPYVLVGRGKSTGFSTAATTVSAKTRAWQIGTTYDLSKRTYTYLSIGQDKNSGSSVTAGLNTTTETKRRGYSLGVVHSF